MSELAYIFGRISMSIGEKQWSKVENLAKFPFAGGRYISN
jgi:hypothetical protein